MRMRRRYHAWRKDCLHVLSRIGLTGDYRKRADLGNTFASRWPPSLVCNCEEPNLSKRLDDGTTNSFRCFSLSQGRISIQVPKGLRLGELPDGLLGDDPTSYLACTLSNRPANLRRGYLAGKEQDSTR
jgi:hypothetical protein